MQKTVFESRKSSKHSQQQSPFSRLRLIVQKSHGPDCSAARVRAFMRHASSKKGLQQADINTGSKTVELSRFRTHVAPVVMETSCDKTGNAPEGALFTETRMPVETHLMSNVSLGRATLSHMAPGKTRLRFVPWSCPERFQVSLSRYLHSGRSSGFIFVHPAAHVCLHVE